MSDGDSGGLLVVLVICHCVNATEATMETARLVEEDQCEVDASVGCKAERKYMAVTLQDCLPLQTLTVMYILMATFVEEDGASMVPLNSSPCRRRED